MSREQERMRRKLEKNPAVECNKIRQKYCLDLFHDFANTKDPRHLSYTDYSNRELLGTVYYKGIAGIESMQSMVYEFNQERVVGNLYRFKGKKRKNISRMQSRSMIILKGWSLMNCKKCSRNRFTVSSAAKHFMMQVPEKVACHRRRDTDLFGKPQA